MTLPKQEALLEKNIIKGRQEKKMKEVLFTIGPFQLYGYGFMIAIGVLAAYITAEYRARKRKMEHEHIFHIVILCVLGGFVAAKLLFWITEWKSILEDPGFLLRTIGDGFVVYGGIIGGILTGYLYARVKKLDFLKFFDLFMPSIALAQGFGRLGCLLSGCCYGKETTFPLSITFQDSSYAPNHVALIPTQIYSSLLDFLHFGVLLWIARHKKADGQVAAAYLVFYSIGRFVLEFFRGDLERGNVGVLSTSQFISVFICAAGILLFAVVGKRNRSSKERQ